MNLQETDAIIGVDPGGGLAIWRKGVSICHTLKMPKDLHELNDYLVYINSICKQPLAFIEKVNVRPDDIGDRNDPVNRGKIYRIETMVKNYTRLQEIFYNMKIPYVLVHPMTWQAKLNLRMKGEEKKDRKNRYKAFAAEKYPNIKRVTLWNADAILIMHFARFMLKNNPEYILDKLPRYITGRQTGINF